MVVNFRWRPQIHFARAPCHLLCRWWAGEALYTSARIRVFFLRQRKLPGLTWKGSLRLWCIVMLGCWSLLCWMVWSYELWIWIFHNASLIPSIPEYHEALCRVGDLDVHWSQAGLGLEVRSDTTGSLCWLGACILVEGYWTINFQAFSSAGPSHLVVPARARKFHFGSLHRQLEVKKHRMPDKISLILFRLFWSCTKNFDSPAVAGLFTDCNTWGLERLDSYPSRGGMQRGTLSDLKWEASKLVTQVVHRQTNQVCFSLKCLSSQLARGIGTDCWFSVLF